MLIKKFGSMLLALTLMLSCIPGTMVSAADSWVHVEAEAGTVKHSNAMIYTEEASGGQYPCGNDSNRGQEVTMNFSVPVEGSYDIWAVLSTSPDDLEVDLGYHVIDLDGINIMRKSSVDVKDNMNGGHIYTTVGLWWGNPMSARWVKVASNQTLTGNHTLKWSTEQRADGIEGGMIDCVRIVPSSWNWKAGANFDEPTPTPAPSGKLVEFKDFAIVNGASGSYAQVTDIKAVDANAKTAVVILAVYQGDTLYGVYPSAVTTLTSAAQTITSGTVTTIPAGATLKAFLWDGLNTAMPYADFVE